MNDEAVVISFINLKGGVGKTSTAINIADTLATKDCKVLVIDMDPQFNATQALLNHQLNFHKSEIEESLLLDTLKEIEDSYETTLDLENTLDSENEANSVENYKKEISSQLLYNKLKAQGNTVRTLFTNETVVSEIKNPSLIHRIRRNLDIIPGDLDLFESLSGDTSGKHNVLEDHFLSYKLREVYNYIIIDCPPNWTILTQASLFASDYYIVPSKIDLFSSVGIGLLENLVYSTFYDLKSSIHRIYSIYRRELNRDSIKPLGVLFTLTHEMTIASKLKERLQGDIPLPFFDAEIPYHSSVPLKFSLYNESGSKHEALKNSITRVVTEMNKKISILEETNG